MPTPLIRIIPTTHPPSTRLLDVMSSLGMGVRHTARGRAGPILRALLRASLVPGTISLITGPSGSGKSTLLRTLHAGLLAGGARCQRVDAPPEDTDVGSLLDALPGDAHAAARTLSAAGLADAALWARSPRELSQGERTRFSLARAVSHITPTPLHPATPVVLLWDECASVLDRTTARSVCTSLARFIRRSPSASLVCATAHDDVAPWLSPDCSIHCDLASPPRVVPHPQRKTS